MQIVRLITIIIVLMSSRKQTSVFLSTSQQYLQLRFYNIFCIVYEHVKNFFVIIDKLIKRIYVFFSAYIASNIIILSKLS